MCKLNSNAFLSILRSDFELRMKHLLKTYADQKLAAEESISQVYHLPFTNFWYYC